jgi:ribose 5-phosphate isomerase A
MKAIEEERQSFRSLAEAAMAFVQDGMVVGLGSGHTVAGVIELLRGRVREGLRVQGVPTSRDTAQLATRLGIPLVSPDDIEAIDVTVDGADEVAPNLDLIKGLGGALVREKIVASASRRFVIVVTSEKLVSTLGEHGLLPIEVVPFGLASCRQRLAHLGYPSILRQVDGTLFETDNGNRILDCQIGPISDLTGLEMDIRAIPGVVGTGLFLGMADTVFVADQNDLRIVEERWRGDNREDSAPVASSRMQPSLSK